MPRNSLVHLHLLKNSRKIIQVYCRAHRRTGPVPFRGAEVSGPNILSIACPKIKWFCPNITLFFIYFFCPNMAIWKIIGGLRLWPRSLLHVKDRPVRTLQKTIIVAKLSGTRLSLGTYRVYMALTHGISMDVTGSMSPLFFGGKNIAWLLRDTLIREGLTRHAWI